MHAAPAEYTGHRLPTEPTLVDLRAAVSDYEAICLANIAAVVDRFETHADYPFVDTKLDLQTGRDFPADDPIRGYAAIYGWIQGRGLEALAGHAIWLESYDDPAMQALAGRLRAMVRTVLASLRRMRDANDGHLYFFMRPDGTPFALDQDGQPQDIPLAADAPSNFSDLFCAKGMLAAARCVGDAAAETEALAYAERVTAALCWRDSNDGECLRIWAACHNAFIGHFVQPEVHLMSIQTRAEDGSISDAIPATADADPGYHTGLSLLDVIEVVNEIKG